MDTGHQPLGEAYTETLVLEPIGFRVIAAAQSLVRLQLEREREDIEAREEPSTQLIRAFMTAGCEHLIGRAH